MDERKLNEIFDERFKINNKNLNTFYSKKSLKNTKIKKKRVKGSKNLKEEISDFQPLRLVI